VLRSTLDYHRRPAEFLAWLAGCTARGVRLFNPAPLVRWNHHKAYLLDLERAGVPIVPTALVSRGAAPSLDALVGERGWDEVVVKPAIGASAWHTFRTRSRAPSRERERFAELVAAGDVLVQPFLDEIAAGELSFLCFGGELSHVVRKRHAPGDFRVQGEYGGRSEVVAPGESTRRQARRVADAIPGPWLYARIDAVERGGDLLLMELELIEPELFLALDPRAPARLADALVRRAALQAPPAGAGAQGTGIV
jgi:glutathione synthase/RimK-type ligase-like ATP-grasp enzyme